MNKLFTASQFTPTQWDTSEDKARFANHFARFVAKGCPWSLFHKWFYNRLSNCFGHIAHYNRAGFYETWFAEPKDRAAFLYRVLSCETYGSPEYTYSDVENVLRVWVSGAPHYAGFVNEARRLEETSELAELARLKDKYKADA